MSFDPTVPRPGTPTVQDGAIYRVDLTTGTLKPWNVTVRTVQVLDENGNPVTIQVICPLA